MCEIFDSQIEKNTDKDKNEKNPCFLLSVSHFLRLVAALLHYVLQGTESSQIDGRGGAFLPGSGGRGDGKSHIAQRKRAQFAGQAQLPWPI